ncbi:pyridoxamine 5'-phosphate oxidase family protein [Streptomyces wuyuanensis]|uniref:pyridoxamine 5'-phosphate oxidase family protein n=1 Tax=Streptomyces wuyuanensis TaxID=1196353 RepID=UPI0036A969A0
MSTNLSDSRYPWHHGEVTMQRLLGVPYFDNPTTRGLPMEYGLWMAQSPLFALGTVDENGHLWTTILGGQPGTTRPIEAGVLALSSLAHLERRPEEGNAERIGFDPVLEALFSDKGSRISEADDGKIEASGDGPFHDARVVNHGGSGKQVSGLAINLETRSRVKLAGRMLGGAVLARQPEENAAAVGDEGRPVNVHMAVAVDETLGNCPKYLNRKIVWPHEASPTLVSDVLPLPPEAVALIGKSDIFLITSRHGTETMDTNVRGGAPGFVRVFSNSGADDVSLVYPEYSGNQLYQTLGNLKSDPTVGITFPDFETGDILYVTGRAEILIGADAASVLPHSKLAVRVKVEAARFVRDGLPFRGRLLDQSPYNPPVRKLTREINGSDSGFIKTDADGKATSVATATLIRKSAVTPTISRYTFRLAPDPSSSRSSDEFSNLKPWRAGQHVLLDFSAKLDRGYSHMREHDPRSLNDDYIRSFTITSPPAPLTGHTAGKQPESLTGAEFEITVRKQGPVTNLLAGWNPGSSLEAAVLGFGGEEDMRFADTTAEADADDDTVVVAAGVGITPLMAQAQPALEAGRRLKVLWSLRADDLPLAVDVLGRLDGLGTTTKLFVTGAVDAGQDAEIENLRRLGAQVHTRRIEKADVLAEGVAGRRRFYVCTGPSLRRSVLEWTVGEYVKSESFDY